MKTKLAATALILASGLIAGNSFAADTGPLTREQVRATVLQARADGSLEQMNEGVKNAFKAAKSTPSAVTREAVTAEYHAAQKAGTLPQIGEFGALAGQPAFVSTRTRADVRTDAVIAAHTRVQEFGG